MWVYDSNNNKCSTERFGSEEKAREALDSLINCKNCTNCKYCEGCTNCNNCYYCKNCLYCEDCANCIKCENCNSCSDIAAVVYSTNKTKNP